MRFDISVIIPTYNRIDTIARALDSVYAQTHLPDEVIVIDDGSTDGTTTYIQQHYPQVILIAQDNHGVSHARNTGIKRAQGQWIALLDSDDAWHPDKLAEQVSALRAKPERLMCHTNEMWMRNGVRVNPMQKHEKSGGWIYRQCLGLCVISPSTVLIHHSIFAAIGYFDESLPACEDYDLWLRITAKWPVLYLPELLTIKYGGHVDQLSHQFWGMDRFRIKALCKSLDSGDLTPENANAARDTLLEKIQLYLRGARKHNNVTDINYYEQLLQHYR